MIEESKLISSTVLFELLANFLKYIWHKIRTSTVLGLFKFIYSPFSFESICDPATIPVARFARAAIVPVGPSFDKATVVEMIESICLLHSAH